MNYCPVPYEILFLHSGFVTTCCPNWIQYENYSHHITPNETPTEIWESTELEKLRKQIQTGTTTQCQKCPLHKKNPPKPSLYKTTPLKTTPSINKGPKGLFIADSFTCNLQCKSCRPNLITTDPNATEKQKLLLQIMDTYAPTLQFINILASGEIFTSPRHIQFLKEYPWKKHPNLQIEIITNATLLQTKWNKIAPAHPNINHLTISIDAATKNTYTKVRQGGKWEDTQNGLKFAANLQLKELQTTYIIQADNVHEIAQFAHNSLKNGATNILYSQLAQSYMSLMEYTTHNVFNPKHPKHPILLEQLKDPIFKDKRTQILDFHKILPEQ